MSYVQAFRGNTDTPFLDLCVSAIPRRTVLMEGQGRAVLADLLFSDDFPEAPKISYRLGMRPWRSWIARQTPTFLTAPAEMRRKAL